MIPRHIDFKCKRLALGVTQRELSRHCWVGQTFISNYEAGLKVDENLIEHLWRGLTELISENKEGEEWMRFRLRYHMELLEHGGELDKYENLWMIRALVDDMLAEYGENPSDICGQF